MRRRRRRRGIPRCWRPTLPKMLLRSQERGHSFSRIRGRLRAEGSHSRSGRAHPSPLFLLPFLLLMFPPNTTRKRKRPRQTNTQRQRKRPILLSLLFPPQVALRFSLKLTQHRTVTTLMRRRKTCHSSSFPCSVFICVCVGLRNPHSRNSRKFRRRALLRRNAQA